MGSEAYLLLAHQAKALHGYTCMTYHPHIYHVVSASHQVYSMTKSDPFSLCFRYIMEKSTALGVKALYQYVKGGEPVTISFLLRCSLSNTFKQ